MSDDLFIPTVKIGDENFTTIVKSDGSTATLCDLCGASILDRDKHWDWHAALIEALDKNGTMLSDVISILKEGS